MTTAVSVVNYALQLIDSQAQITALNDGSVEASAANVVYVPTVQMLLRQLDPDFAYTTVALSLSGSALAPWSFQYAYPADCLRVRQIAPALLADPNDPQPIRAQVAFSGGAKVILTNQASALANYTTSSVTETQWDAAFIETVARRLGNPLAMAIAGRPDFARELLEESERYAGMAELVDDSRDGTA